MTNHQKHIHNTEAGEEGFIHPLAFRLRYFRRIRASRMFVPNVNGGEGAGLAPVTVAHERGRQSQFEVAF